MAAEHHQMPLFAYMKHLEQVREKYGGAAANFEVDLTLAIRDERIEAIKEVNRQRNG